MTDEATNQTPKRDALAAAAECAASPDDPIAAKLRGFGPLGIAAMVVVIGAGSVVPPLRALPVLAWAHLSRTPWREIGYVRPRRWLESTAIGVAFGVAFKLLMKAVVMPLLGADPINRTYHGLVGNRAAIPATLLALVLGAGVGEETVFRGFLFERFGKLLGHGLPAKAATVLLTAALFGLAHFSDQGLTGTEHAAIVGLVFGAIYATTGRLWMLMVAHAAFDLTAYAIIYWDLERAVAGVVFG